MAVTRIKNNQITDATITAQKIANQTLVGSLFSPDLTLVSNLSIVGNLTVTGNTSNINAINTFVTDPFVIFNNGYSGSLANYTIGFLVNRNLASLSTYGAVNTAWVWSEADSAFVGLATTDTGVGITSINNSGYANIKIGNLEVVTSVTASNFNITSATITGGSAGTLAVTNFSSGNAVISGGYISALANATIATGNAQSWYATTLNSTTGNITTLTSTTVNAGTTTTGVLNATTGNITTLGAGTTTTGVLNATTGNITTLGAGTTTTGVLNATTGNITTGNAQIWYATQLNSTTGNITTLGVTTLNVGTTTTGVLNATTGNITTLGVGTTTTGILNVTTANITTIGAGTTTTAVLNTTNGNITNGNSTTFVATNFSAGNARISSGYADNFPIGANIKATGAFTTLTSTGLTTFTDATQSTTASDGAVVVTGGVGIGKNLNVGGNVIISGNLTVQGDVTTLNTSTLDVEDLNITIAKGAANPAAANGAGLTVDGANATILYNSAPDAWTFNKGALIPTLVTTNFSSGNAVITGGSVNNTVIGNTTPAVGTFTNLRATGNILADSGTISTTYTTGALVVPGDGGVGIGGNLNVRGKSDFTGNITAGNILVTGNINVTVGAVASSFGVFYGNAAGIGALYAGAPGYTPLDHTVLQMTADLDNYAQVNFQNINTSAKASTDYVATADNGNDEQGYINLGINSSTFSDIDYPEFYPNDGYLIQNGVGTAGNLLIISEIAGTAIKFRLGGYGAVNEQAVITNKGFTVNATTASTNITSGALVVNGGAGIAGNVYAAGNVILGTGTTSNVVVAATTTSTNNTTGALVVRGGAGIGGNLFATGASVATFGDNTTLYSGYSTLSNKGIYHEQGSGPKVIQLNLNTGSGLGLYSSGSATTNYLYASGGIQFATGSTLATKDVPTLGSVGVQIAANGAIIAQSDITSTTTGTGALIVVGGVGISGNLNIGGNINSPSNIVVNSTNSATTSFVVHGVNDNTLIWARPNATYDSVVIGNSATTGDLVTGAKLFINTTDSIRIPTGTTAQRPSSAGGTDVVGMTRMNSTTTQMEYYDGFQWQTTGGAQFTIIESDGFTGDDSTVDFTLAGNTTTNGCMVSINGIVQNPSSAYSVGGPQNKTLTFTQAPASGDVIDVRRFTTTSTISSFSSQNGYSSVIANNDALIFTSGPSSAVERMKIYPNGNVAVTGNIIPSANLTYNLGSTTAWWNVIYGKATQATYADLAENYQADSLYSAGTVLEFGGEFEVTACMSENSTRVAGIVSTNPAHLMNGGLRGSNVVPLALMGRVPCMVIGPVRKGDMMVSAGYGYAKASSAPQMGTVIGKALSNFDGDKGVIEVVVGRV